MKDKRLDILGEHFDCDKIKIKTCKYCITDQGCKWCTKMMKDGFPTKVKCEGIVFKCELED